MKLIPYAGWEPPPKRVKRDITVKRTRLTAEQKATIQRLDTEGLSRREIAREVGCAQSTVTKILGKAEPEAIRTYDHEGIKAELLAGATYRAVQDKFCCSPSVVASVAKTLDLPRRAGRFSDRYNPTRKAA